MKPPCLARTSHQLLEGRGFSRLGPNAVRSSGSSGSQPRLPGFAGGYLLSNKFTECLDAREDRTRLALRSLGYSQALAPPVHGLPDRWYQESGGSKRTRPTDGSSPPGFPIPPSRQNTGNPSRLPVCTRADGGPSSHLSLDRNWERSNRWWPPLPFRVGALRRSVFRHDP